MLKKEKKFIFYLFYKYLSYYILIIKISFLKNRDLFIFIYFSIRIIILLIIYYKNPELIFNCLVQFKIINIAYCADNSIFNNFQNQTEYNRTIIIQKGLEQTYENISILNYLDSTKSFFKGDDTVFCKNKIKYNYIYNFNDNENIPESKKTQYLDLKEKFLEVRTLKSKQAISLKCEMLDVAILSRKNSTFCNEMYCQMRFCNEIQREIFSNSLILKSEEIITKAVNIHYCIKSHPLLSDVIKDDLLIIFRKTLRSDISNQFLFMEKMFDKLQTYEKKDNPLFSQELDTYIKLNIEILDRLKKMSGLKWNKAVNLFTAEDLKYLNQILSGNEIEESKQN